MNKKEQEMKCPKCGKELKAIRCGSEEVDSFQVTSVLPETIVRIPWKEYDCVPCGITVKERLEPKHYKLGG